jgi:hypothetical protein
MNKQRQPARDGTTSWALDSALTSPYHKNCYTGSFGITMKLKTDMRFGIVNLERIGWKV